MAKIEVRGYIDDIEKVRNRLEDINAIYKGEYDFKDLIFTLGEKPLNEVNDYLRLRQIIKSARQDSGIKFDKKLKTSEGQEIEEVSKLYKRRDNAIRYIRLNFKDYRKILEYSRKGWEYFHGRCNIFVEDIENLGPSLEIEAWSPEEVEGYFKVLEIEERYSKSVADLVWDNRILQ
jgi:adenylate cyclase class IV